VAGAARPLSRYLRAIPQAHLYAGWFVRTALLFRNPLRFIGHYFARTSPRDRLVWMRDGSHIHLSDHPHDLITLFVIFVRRDYGSFPGRGTVVDIGANLGLFALFAGRQGARRVIAYEPNSAACALMEQNIEHSGLTGVVVPRRFAVSGEAGRTVRFPIAASVYNTIADEGAQGEFETVQTTSLARIVEEQAPDGIDLLKLDCEGAEYDILYAPDAPLHKVRELRMEYHAGRGGELRDFLASRGFRIDRFEPDSPSTGMLWATRLP
jgi:FkbM family methyltransferase